MNLCFYECIEANDIILLCFGENEQEVPIYQWNAFERPKNSHTMIYTLDNVIWNQTNVDRLRKDLLKDYDVNARPEHYMTATQCNISLTLINVDLDETRGVLTSVEFSWNYQLRITSLISNHNFNYSTLGWRWFGLIVSSPGIMALTVELAICTLQLTRWAKWPLVGCIHTKRYRLCNWLGLAARFNRLQFGRSKHRGSFHENKQNYLLQWKSALGELISQRTVNELSNKICCLIVWTTWNHQVPTAKFETYCPLNLKLWPFDVQTCSIKVNNINYPY